MYNHSLCVLFTESDTESIPSPCKNQKNADDSTFKIKSLEELRLEQIQKHDAALYQYDKDTDAKSKVKNITFSTCEFIFTKLVSFI